MHGQYGCVSCHGGTDGVDDAAVAHEGMITRPSTEAEETCGKCHAATVSVHGTSMHQTFNGYVTLFETRSGMDLEANPALEHEFKAECGNCHTTCGQCHTSFPKSVGGGLAKSHMFIETPSQSDQCTSCHGSRVGEEYTGTNRDEVPDYHFSRMNCMGCHSGTEMHGDGALYGTRYNVGTMPRCEDCHTNPVVRSKDHAFGSTSDNLWHQKHGDNFQCQVCHSQDYKNCNACHVAGGGITGRSYIDFKMGRNPIPAVRPEYEFVVLRHIPIAPDTYEPWSEAGAPANLANFDALPTWKYTSPHNVRRWTARTDTTGNKSCGEACHSTPDAGGWFLRQADLDTMSAEEASANAPYIVPDGSPVGWGTR